MGSSSSTYFGISSPNNAYSFGAWHMATVTLSGGQFELFIDAVSVSTGSCNASQLEYQLHAAGNSTATNYIDTLSAPNGCDSIIHTTIDIIDIDITQNDTAICLGDSISLIASADLDSSTIISSGIICDVINEGGSITLTAPNNGIITGIDFASYGMPLGSCGSFSIGWCHAASSYNILQNSCVGQNSCTVAATNNVFGDPCVGTGKFLAVQATYTEITTNINSNVLWSSGDTTQV